MRLVSLTKLPSLFETTKEERHNYLEHLKTIENDSDGWLENLHFTILHHELLNTDGKNIKDCDEFLRKFYSVDHENVEERQLGHHEERSYRILQQFRCDVMKHYLKKNEIKEAQSLIDCFE